MMRHHLLLLGACVLLASIHLSWGQVTCSPRDPLQSAIDDVFQPQSDNNADDVDDDEDDCACVPYYLCANNTIIEDGRTLIDIRLTSGSGGDDRRAACSTAARGSCADSMEIWCLKPNRLMINPNCDDTNGIPHVSNYKKTGCGQRNSEGVGFRITGQSDNEAQFGEFPWMVALLVESEGNSNGPPLNIYQCGGSLINPQVVLTAAHCVFNKSPRVLKVRSGEWDTQTTHEILPHQDRRVKSVIIHDQYYAAALYNDIALLILDSPVVEGENVAMICLPRQGEVFEQTTRCVASGWGKDVFGKNGLYQVILKSIELPIVPRGECQRSLQTTRLGKYFKLHNSFVCAGGEAGKDVCKGDGGSPLACPMDDGYYQQVGTVAWGVGCGESGVPGVYGNVALFRDWIDQQVIDNGFSTDSYSRNLDIAELARSGNPKRG